jgi:hypothetical protein
MSLYSLLPEYVPSKVKNTKKWQYGYDEKYDVVIISKDGTLGDVYDINGLKVGLPRLPKGNLPKGNNKWTPKEYPKELASIKSIFEWNVKPNEFKVEWVEYIQDEFTNREDGYWFMNNGKPTYITGSHYMYLQWSKIDIGLPDFRESNRIFFIFWEACKADDRCFGMCYLKNRRSGFSFMSSSETANIGTISKDAKLGILSKTGADAKEMFINKVVPIVRNYPFFFKPIQDGMDNPKTELSFRVPAKKITKKNMSNVDDDKIIGLDTTIDWLNTADNSYDGQKLLNLVHDECYDPETEIMMSDWSFKKIKDIEIGDKVMISGGIIKNVVKKTFGNTDMYSVKQKWGNDYIVSENHRLVLEQYIYNGRDKSKKRIEKIMTPKEYMSLSKYKKQHTFSVKSKPIDCVDSELITIHPYLLGLWIGDGRKNEFTIIVNKDKDPELLDYLGKMSQIFNIPFEIKKSTSKSAVYFKFKGINKELEKINVRNNKHIPYFYKTSSIDTRLQLLAGLLDSDGYSDKNKNCITFGMKNKAIIEDIRIIAMSCGLSCSNVKEKNTNFKTKSYNISISGNLSIIPSIIERKSFNDYSELYSNRRCGMDIEYLGKGDYVGIQVDGTNDDERKLILSDFTISLNSGKWLSPNNILNNWRVTKTCLRLGSRIVGKCMMGSTVNALAKGGQNFKDLYHDSMPSKRNANGQTKSGLYSLFIPMEYNMEGFIDEFGYPVIEDPETPVMGIDGRHIKVGAVSYWQNEVDALKNDADALNEFYRQYPRTESHAFRDESRQSLFNLTKIYQQIDYNDSLIKDRVLTRGSFHWRNGEKDTEVIWTPDSRGRFLVSWLPPDRLRNKFVIRNGKKCPANDDLGAFGCDPYDISGVVGGGGSNGALHGLTTSNLDPDVPSNMFFLEYVARPQTADIFFEEVLMACVFYGMPILAENNKARMLYHFKNRGYRGYSMNRPDKHTNQLSKTEIEIGGIPNTSEDIKQTHASCIESYVEQYVGFDTEGTYRDPEEIGNMYFIRTLEDWAKYDISNRTKYDASISSGLAIMATRRHMFKTEQKKSKIMINFAKYDNRGSSSQIIR